MIEGPVPPPWTAPAAAQQSLGGSQPAYLAEPPAPNPASKRTRAQIVLCTLLVLALAAAGLLVVFGGAKSPSAAVSLAARTSTAATSAHITVTGTVTEHGSTIPVNGTGEVDFATNSSQLTSSSTVFGHHVAEKSVFVSGTVYVNIPQLGSLLGGKSWISIDLSSLGTAAAQGGFATGVNPAAWLQLLTFGGSQVTALGTSTIGGTAVQGYAAVISPATLRSQIASTNLPSWLGSVLSAATYGPTDVKVYVENTDLIRRVTVTSQFSAGASGPVVTHESTNYSSYGAPVTVTAPPANQVETFEQLIKTLGTATNPT